MTKLKSSASQLGRNFKIAALAAVCALSFHHVAAAADVMPVAVVDVQQVLREATATSTLQKKIEGLQKNMQEQAQKDGASWNSKSEELQKKKATLSEADFKAKMTELEKGYTAAQKARAEKMSQVQQSLDKASDKVRTSLDGVMKKVAEKHNVQVLLNKQATLYSPAALDMTAEVLSEMNASIPSIDIALPAS